MTAVSLTRKFAGVGDWLMALAVLKMVNRQRRDVEVYVSFDTPHEAMPELVPQAFFASDVRWRVGEPSWPCHRTGHLVYRRRSQKPFIEDMLDVFVERTGLAIAYDPVWPTFSHRPPASSGYIAMVSHGKRRVAGGKEWGAPSFAQLAELLARRHELVQIGAAGDEPLEHAHRRYLGGSFATVASVLAGARLFIGLENGLTVLAGYLGVPLFTLYCGAGFPDRLIFNKHTQVREPVSPSTAASLVERCI